MSSSANSPGISTARLDTHLCGDFIDRREGQDLEHPRRCDNAINSELSASPHVDIWIFYQPNIWWRTIGPVCNGLYSLKNDKALRNALYWPRIKYQLYDVEQDKWADIPTFSHIEIRPHDFLLIRRTSGPKHEYGDMGKLIKELRGLYYLAAPPVPPHSPHSCSLPKELSPCASRTARVTHAPKRAHSPDDDGFAPPSKKIMVESHLGRTVKGTRNTFAAPSGIKLETDSESVPELEHV